MKLRPVASACALSVLLACGHHAPRAATPASQPHLVVLAGTDQPNDIRAAIGRALASQGFSPERDVPGSFVASYTRGARSLRLGIDYNPQQVVFHYIDSQGMIVGADAAGQPLLDRHYTSLLQALDVAIKFELTRQPQAMAPPPPTDLGQIIAAQAQSAAPGAMQVGNLFEGNGDKTDWSVALDPGHCYWFIGAGEPGKVNSLYLFLWDPQNHRVTDTKSVSNTVMIGHCPTQPGMFKFQAKIDSGSGAYKVGVFARGK